MIHSLALIIHPEDKTIPRMSEYVSIAKQILRIVLASFRAINIVSPISDRRKRRPSSEAATSLAQEIKPFSHQTNVYMKESLRDVLSRIEGAKICSVKC